jgi:hypothetical protein
MLFLSSVSNPGRCLLFFGSLFEKYTFSDVGRESVISSHYAWPHGVETNKPTTFLQKTKHKPSSEREKSSTRAQCYRTDGRNNRAAQGAKSLRLSCEDYNKRRRKKICFRLLRVAKRSGDWPRAKEQQARTFRCAPC